MVEKGYLLNVLIWAWFGDQGMVSDVGIRVKQKNGRPLPPGYNWLYLKKRSFRQIQEILLIRSDIGERLDQAVKNERSEGNLDMHSLYLASSTW